MNSTLPRRRRDCRWRIQICIRETNRVLAFPTHQRRKTIGGHRDVSFNPGQSLPTPGPVSFANAFDVVRGASSGQGMGDFVYLLRRKPGKVLFFQPSLRVQRYEYQHQHRVSEIIFPIDLPAAVAEVFFESPDDLIVRGAREHRFHFEKNRVALALVGAVVGGAGNLLFRWRPFHVEHFKRIAGAKRVSRIRIVCAEAARENSTEGNQTRRFS
jgi:hypothetical protein